MRNRIKIVSVIALLCVACSYAHGIEHQDTLQVYRAEEYITFRVGNIVVDENFDGNDQRLSRIIKYLNTVFADSILTITSVEFTGMASPEGPMDNNFRLSRQRMEALSRYVRSRVDIPDSIVIYRDQRVSWQYLDSVVVNSDMEYRNEVSHIINNTPIYIFKNNVIVDGRKKQLMDFNLGRTWHEMDRRFFSYMRNAAAIIVTLKKVQPPIEEQPILNATAVVVPPIVEVKEEAPAIVVDTVPEVKDWTRHLYLKTNAVGLGMLIANAAVELDLSPHWSFTLPVYYSAWNYFSPTVKFRTFCVQPEIRYWFSDNDGWYVGAHFGMAYYNFAWDSDYRIQDKNKKTPAIGGGLSVGYRMPISKNKRWKMEFSLGGGVYDLNYDKFLNEYNGFLVESVKETFFGIDQVAVSFSYMFDLKKKRR